MSLSPPGLWSCCCFTARGKGYETRNLLWVCIVAKQNDVAQIHKLLLIHKTHKQGNIESEHSHFIMWWDGVRSCSLEFLHEKYCTLFAFWWSQALGSKRSGQSKAFGYYQAEKSHPWRRFLSARLMEVVPSSLVVWEVFLQVCIRGNTSPCFIIVLK